MKKVLGEIKAEVTVLSRTENILKSRAENLDEFLKSLEKEKGILGFSNVQDKIQGISEVNEVLNNKKDSTL
jgi:intraflagellar transport protein 81